MSAEGVESVVFQRFPRCSNSAMLDLP